MNNDFMDNNMSPVEENIEICSPGAPFLYAHAYIPFQYLSTIYTPMEALNQGTVFPELDRPYGLDPEYTVDA